MNSLSRIPIWAWYLFSVAFCYAMWNPYYSMYQLMSADISIAVKGIALVVSMIIASMYIVEGHKSVSIYAVVLFFALFGFLFWWAETQTAVHGFIFSYLHLWGQWIIGLLLTIALQGGRIYRSITGRVPVGTTMDDTAEGHHHG